MSEHDEDGYSGEAVLVIDGTEIAATVDLRGYFQPIDGYYRWYGRVATNEQVSAAAGGKKTAVEIRAGEYSAKGELSDPDPWDRYRIMGTSTPPFHVPTSLEELNDLNA
ncbi:DUF4873 domain-containing protein [Amycolatopsis decaplanina]|uniref:Flavin binding monooxygenase n=1 Tax=Amycolatopsis decaplanina DSM 44594 TaxID=1284240 RepID=M2X8K5_9PSEU|nr:DUF4873 domain-containing protein [Amycolatopsis decaplanina]EME57441.1 flavin binding monooxygenase [Amycolatopsis decaplanina DSM 44594]